MNNQARYNSRRGRTRRRRGQYIVGNMGHPQNGGGQGQAPVPFPPQYLVGNMGYPQNGGGPGQAPVPFPLPPPPPPVVAYPAYGQVPYPAPQQPYMYPPFYGPAVYQNAVPLGQQPYAHPVPVYMSPYPQSQVNQAAQGQAYMPQLTQGGGNNPAQVPSQHHGLRLRRRRRRRVQARGRGNGRGNRGQPNRRRAGRDNNSARQAAQVVQQSSSEAGVAERNPLAALPVPLEQSSGLDSRGIKQEDTGNESALVAQNIGSTEIKREPVIKQEPQ